MPQKWEEGTNYINKIYREKIKHIYLCIKILDFILQIRA